MKKIRLYTTDEIIKIGLKEKKEFDSHPDDINYSSHHKECWVLLDDLNIDSIKGILSRKQEYIGNALLLDDIKKIIK